MFVFSMVVLVAGAFVSTTTAVENLNVCHKAGPNWNFMDTPDVSARDGHLGHGDFLYTGPEGTEQEKDAWCQGNSSQAPSTATITLVKHLDNSDGGTATNADWTLSAVGSSNISGVTGDDSITNASVLPGLYTLSESVGPSDYTASAWDCTGTGDANGNVISLAAGDVATCSITNTYVPPSHPDETSATIHATKIVCPTEDLLPNWGDNDPEFNITSNTATRFLNANTSCHEEVWTFEWAPSATSNPGDNNETGGGDWTSFSGGTSIPAGSRIWVREQIDSDYIPFSGDVSSDGGWDDVSAELYCSTDVLNYDNYDWIDPVVAGETYNCVAFNVLTDEPNVPIENTCFVPATSENEIIELGNSPEGELPLQSILDTIFGLNTLDAENDQVNSQFWTIDPSADSVTFDVELIGKQSGNSQNFGYYEAGNPGSFTSIFTTPPSTVGTTFSVTIPSSFGTDIGFATDTSPSDAGKRFSETAENSDTSDHTRVYNPLSNVFALAFEDLFHPGWDEDYNDIVVKISDPVCEESCEPTEGMISSDEDTEVTNVVTNLADPDTTVDYSAVPVSSVATIQTLAPGVWDATTSDVNAKWIWSEDPVTGWQADKWSTFERTFNVDGNPDSGTLEIASDNSYEVWVNDPTMSGSADFSDANENNHTSTDSYNVTSLLQNGSNTLTIRVKNWALPNGSAANNPGGLLYTLSWTTTCDQVEDDSTTITIVKETVGGEGTFEFDGLDNGFSLTTTGEGEAGSDSQTFEELTPGIDYTIGESALSGWDLTSKDCQGTNWNNQWAQNQDGSISVNLQAGSNVTCTFTNTKQEEISTTGTLIVHKDVVGPDEEDVSDNHGFKITLDEGDQKDVSENSNYTYLNLVPGTYTLAEITGDPDFDLLRISGDDDDDASNGAPVTIIAGQNTDVTVTNKQRPQCSDGKDNDEDQLIDSTDPGCHSDGDAGNSGTYVPSDNDETDSDGPNNIVDVEEESGGTISGSIARPFGQVLGAETSVCNWDINTYMRRGHRNDVEQVKILQRDLLNGYMRLNIPVTGFYGPLTEGGVRAFQLAKKDKILTPWGLTLSTGIFYKTTLVEAKNTICPEQILPIPTDLIPWSLNAGQVPRAI